MMTTRSAVLFFAALCAAGLCLGAAPADWAAAPGAFRAHLIVLALILIPALALTGARRRALGLTLIAALSAAAAASSLAPRAPMSGPGREVTLVSANLRRTNAEQAAMARDLLALNADILALQEIPTTFLDDFPEIRRAYPHGRAHFSPTPAGGRAVLSRLPLAPGGPPPRGGDQPGHAAVSIQVGAATLRVMSVHFDWPLIGAQTMQIERFARFADDFHPAPGVHAALVGDFNAAPWSRTVARAGAVAGASPVGGLLGTWRGMAPGALLSALPFGAPLDHILLSPKAGLRAIETAPIAGSDHLALRATLFIPRP
jgi:endonuclease/exonuclease/phosphatase (EEP) superfamily protein YafD